LVKDVEGCPPQNYTDRKKFGGVNIEGLSVWLLLKTVGARISENIQFNKIYFRFAGGGENISLRELQDLNSLKDVSYLTL